MKHAWFQQLGEYVQAESAREKNGTPNDTAIMHLSIKELKDRANTMIECSAVDTDNDDEYFQANAAFQLAIEDRYVHFVQRHQLEKQMLDEDTAGVR